MSTNVFLDAGYAADEATVKAIRSDLAIQLAAFLKRRGLNQVAAAKMLGVPQPTISKIVNGNVKSLSVELLIRLLVRADVPVVIQTGSTPRDAGAWVSVGQTLFSPASTAAPESKHSFTFEVDDCTEIYPPMVPYHGQGWSTSSIDEIRTH